ncbi:MAG: hypothetical protein Q8L29_03670 [archaeon]|nr:hypothetical protein [archaeon]
MINEDKKEFSEETKRNIAKSLEDIKKGRIHKLEDIKKELKLKISS